jgi:lysophospholipase L1-like esterase
MLWVGGSTLAVIVVGVLLVFTVFSPTQPANPQPLTNQANAGTPLPILNIAPTAASLVGDEYLALGDSVAYGVGASPPEQSGYAAVFFNSYLKQIRPNGLTFLNLAIPGETTATFIKRPNAKSQLDKALAEIDAATQVGKRVSPITLTIGGNDVVAEKDASDASKEATLRQFDTNFQEILDQLVAHTGGKSDIIVTTYYNPFGDGAGQGQDRQTAWAVRFNALITQRATERKLKVADFYSPVLGREKELTWIANGDIHPNIAGHAILARQIWLASGFASSSK